MAVEHGPRTELEACLNQRNLLPKLGLVMLQRSWPHALVALLHLPLRQGYTWQAVCFA